MGARIMADKVYTSAEFKRERDNFQALCKDLERTEVKKWLNQILEILMAERAKSQQETENEKLNVLIKKHEELIPSVQKTSVMVDLYWKCYAYGDELIERQEKSLVQLDSKKNIVVDLIAKGKVILEHPDKPKFLEGNVKRIQEGWDDTKKKAQDRLKLLQDTKEAWVGYADNNETIAQQFEVAEEEIKMVKKRYNLEDALSDLKKRQELYNKSNNTISGLFKAINDNFTCMSITLPEDKKKIVDKEIKAVDAKLEVVTRFKDTVAVVEEFCTALVNFDNSLKAVDGWKDAATAELKDIKEASGAMLPEDRVARTMDLQEDIAAKLEILKGCAATEANLLPQGSGVDAHAQAFNDLCAEPHRRSCAVWLHRGLGCRERLDASPCVANEALPCPYILAQRPHSEQYKTNHPSNCYNPRLAVQNGRRAFAPSVSLIAENHFISIS